MAKRFRDTEIWDLPWYMNLNCAKKCLVDFIRDKCDAAGVWQPNWYLVNTYIRPPKKLTEQDLIEIDGGRQFVKLPGGLIYCVGFVAFQYGVLTEKCHPHRKILSLLEKYNLKDRPDFLGYSNPNIRVQEEDKEKEEDKDKEKEKEKVGTPHLFSKSAFFDKQRFGDEISKDETYVPFDAGYYYESVKNWSAQGNKKINWIATAKNFMLKDYRDGKPVFKKEYQKLNHGKNNNVTDADLAEAVRNFHSTYSPPN